MGTETTYRMIIKDSCNLLIAEPFLGVSIDGSPFYPVKDIIEQAFRVSDMALKNIDERIVGHE